MVYIEALMLSAIGIPMGLILGWLFGSVLTPVVLKQLNGIGEAVSVSPVIFAGAVLFSLVTVFISCMKPARTASRVSPIEAIRYTEGSGIKRIIRKSGKGTLLFKMAAANLGRNKSKTIVTIVSMALSVVLLCVTFVFTDGFDMDKYLSDKALADYIVADASYFQYDVSGAALSEETIGYIASNIDTEDGGRTYRTSSTVYEYVPEDWYRQQMSKWNDEENVNKLVEREEKQDGLLQNNVMLYGMENFCLDKLNVFDGDISKLNEGNYIAAAYYSDDYGNINQESNWAKIGDKVKLRFVNKFEYYNMETGEIYPSEDDIPETVSWWYRPKEYHDVEYEVAALVNIPYNLSYRYYSSDQFVLGAENFKKAAADTADIMYYAFDISDDTENQSEKFMSELTQNVMPYLDYESKAIYEAEFSSFRSMFVIMGSALSFITGLVGVLNFLNAVLTGIFARQREFAVLQSVGMTGKQLKIMLVYEGLFYALGAALSALFLNVIFSPLIAKLLENMFWFFSFKFTVLPILITIPLFTILGITLPLITYRFSAKKSIVERLRKAE
ncbi:MAG TPA: ABC transporter permease [Ruminococcus sp.]|nr:ABC transporter permease [Ruminococcus sp.]